MIPVRADEIPATINETLDTLAHDVFWDGVRAGHDLTPAHERGKAGREARTNVSETFVALANDPAFRRLIIEKCVEAAAGNDNRIEVGLHYVGDVIEPLRASRWEIVDALCPSPETPEGK